MSNFLHADHDAAVAHPDRRTRSGAERAAWSPLRLAIAYTFVSASYLVIQHLLSGHDYVGFDNDDVMRLVEVRDFLNGQGWFDMQQYRLGLAGGTLMHWSRLIDLPIAALILLFRPFVSPHHAEAIALAVWPTMALAALLYGMAEAGKRLGGSTTAHVAVTLTALYAVAINRFEPGSIDHTNVQLALMALFAARLIAKPNQVAAYAIAGVIAAVAIAIGAETTPLVAVGCVCVAVAWAVIGDPMARSAQVFGLAFATALTAAFYLLVPPSRYAMVTCDALSTGFYVLGTSGGVLLFVAVTALSRRTSALGRCIALAACAITIAVLTCLVAPQCLASPLAGIDPLLQRLWLDHVSEAQPITAMIHRQPFTFPAFYAVPVVACIICLRRVWTGDRRFEHGVLIALIASALAITVVEVRGSVFANLFAFVVMASAIVDARRNYLAARPAGRAAAVFVLLTLVSVPAVWSVAGGFATLAFGRPVKAPTTGKEACSTAKALSPLKDMAGATVAASSNLGVDILRYTPARALSAPYHRNQAGMLDELKIGLATPDKAPARIAASGASILAFCPTEAEALTVSEAAPHGLFAALENGQVPSYLVPLPRPVGSPLQLYRFAPDRR